MPCYVLKLFVTQLDASSLVCAHIRRREDGLLLLVDNVIVDHEIQWLISLWLYEHVFEDLVEMHLSPH